MIELADKDIITAWQPRFIRQNIADVTGEIITVERWNELWNLNINQGDDTTETLKATVNVLLEDVNALATHKTSTDHDGRYYTEEEIDAKVSTLTAATSAVNSALTTHKGAADHDGRYYTEAEIDAKLVTVNGNLNTHKASADHDGRYYTETEIDSKQVAHNTSADHDSRYYTETEIDSKVTTINSNLSTHKTSTDHDSRYYTEAEIDVKVATLSGATTTVSNALTTHKTSTDHDGRYYTEAEVDAMVVKLTGAQTIGGNKTFSLPVIVPNPVNELEAANKIYVDSVAASITQGAIADGSMTDVKLSDLDGQIKQRVANLAQVVDDTVELLIAGGTGTAITISAPSVTAYVGYKKYSFLATANNAGAATTVNFNGLGAIPLYKPGTTTAPSIIAGKAYDIWYEGGSFFLKASAEGDAVTGQVLAGATFSNDSDTGLVGTMPNRGAANLSPSTTNQPIPAGYYNGSGFVLGDVDLVAGNIKNGVNIFGVAGTYTSDATAVAADILSTKTAYVGATKITGTMANKTNTLTNTTNVVSDTGGNVALYCPFNGYVDTSTGIYAYDVDYISANIKQGANIFGLAGTFASDASAVAADILATKTAYVGATKVTGSMVDIGTVNITPSTVNQTIAAGKHSGAGVVYGDSDLIAGNIKAGVNIFGVNGTLVDGANMKRYATGKMTAYTGYYTVTGLAFRPRIIWIKNDSNIHSGLVVNTDHNPQAFVLNGNVYKETTITASSFSIYNNIMTGSTTWYAFE